MSSPKETPRREPRGGKSKTYSNLKYKLLPPMRQAANTPAHHLQKITDPTGVVLKIVLENATVNITDKEGHNVTFSAQLVPEVLGTLLDVEKIYYRGLFSGH